MSLNDFINDAIADHALYVRHRAALRAASDCTIEDRVLLLSYVLWPSAELRAYSEEKAEEELLELKGQGWTTIAA